MPCLAREDVVRLRRESNRRQPKRRPGKRDSRQPDRPNPLFNERRSRRIRRHPLRGRTGAASPEAGGYGLTFEVLTAIIIGGTSLFGGIGTVFGSALGCLLFAETDNGLSVINVNPLYQQIIVGAILVAAVAIDQARRRRQFRLR